MSWSDPYSSALLPTGENIQLDTRKTGEGTSEWSYIVVRIPKAGSHPLSWYRCLQTYGQVPAGWEVGTTHDIHHDQTGRMLATGAEVVGFIEQGKKYDFVPNNKMPLWVFK